MLWMLCGTNYRQKLREEWNFRAFRVNEAYAFFVVFYYSVNVAKSIALEILRFFELLFLWMCRASQNWWNLTGKRRRKWAKKRRKNLSNKKYQLRLPFLGLLMLEYPVDFDFALCFELYSIRFVLFGFLSNNNQIRTIQEFSRILFSFCFSFAI